MEANYFGLVEIKNDIDTLIKKNEMKKKKKMSRIKEAKSDLLDVEYRLEQAESDLEDVKDRLNETESELKSFRDRTDRPDPLF